jgi:two-component system, chemotaxis family, chemotaxis protein CheY
MPVNTNIKVLVVDDFATMRRIVKGVLKQLGFNDIIEAENGHSALEELKKEQIGLIVSDWNMPKMNGLELLKAVRSDASLQGVPFIMVTAEGQKKMFLKQSKRA